METTLEQPLAKAPSPAAAGGAYLNELNDDLELPVRRRGHGHGPRGTNGQIVEENEEESGSDDDAEGVASSAAGGGDHGPLKSLPANAAGGRLIRKAHRRANRANSISEDGKFGGGISGAGAASSLPTGGQLNRSIKNSRKSRSGLGRGLPKKGGAGGKGTWGKLGCELELPWVDPNDPNYESESETSSAAAAAAGAKVAAPGSVVAANKTTKLKTLVPEMGEEDVRKAVEPLILEYFENNDTPEVLCSLQELLMNIGSRRWMIVAILVELAMDHKPSHREMASTLISDLYQKVISQRDIGKAFDYLLCQLPDLVLDTPEAAVILGNFMARAIADDCIPPKFLHSYKGQADNEEAMMTLKKADTLLSMKHGLVRLDNVWGVGGGVRPVKYLVKKIVLLLKEFLCSGDVQEATLCLQELEVPHFHHELVYEAVIMVIESMHEKTEEAMCKLLQSLFRSFIITIEQMRNGFERAYDFMPEISIDVPAAYAILERFVGRCRAAGFITDELVRKMPSRGRKRFVSEGDGGRVKENWF